MGKIIVILLFISALSMAEEETSLKKNCLTCHKAQQIPNTLIYRRYLMKYSTKSRITEAMLRYLKAPTKSTSIMPPQFFLKFPMKEALPVEEAQLRKYIKDYIDLYDVKKILVLEKD